MTLEPFLDASLWIRLHALCAAPAVLLGPVALYRRGRDAIHRWVGRIWVASMAALAASGLLIPSHDFALVGPFGPIHVLSLVTLASLALGVADARAGRFAAHGARMRAVFFGALGLAGLFTLVPGRTLNRMAFPDAPEAGWAAIGLIGTALALLWWRDRRVAVSAVPERAVVTRKKPLHIFRPSR